MVSNTLLAPAPDRSLVQGLPGITAEELEQATAREQHSRAANTARNYGRAMAAFTAWCRSRGVSPLPATAGAIKVYLHLGIEEKGWRPATVRAAFAAISDAHRRAGHEAVVRDPSFQTFLAAVVREDRRRQGQAKPFRETDMDRVRLTACEPRRVRRRMETPDEARARGLMDVAILQVMREALLRVGEAADLRWGDIEFESDGCALLEIRKSKTDQRGEGKIQILSPQIVEDVRAVMPAGPADPMAMVFGLSSRQLVNRIRSACEQAGLGSGYSGHSPRVGMAQDLAAFGGAMPELMESGRWETEGMVYRYTRSQEARRTAVAKYRGIDPESLRRLGYQPEIEGLR